MDGSVALDDLCRTRIAAQPERHPRQVHPWRQRGQARVRVAHDRQQGAPVMRRQAGFDDQVQSAGRQTLDKGITILQAVPSDHHPASEIGAERLGQLDGQ